MKPEIIVNITIQVNNIPTVDPVMLEKILAKNVQDSISAVDYQFTPIEKTLDLICLVVLQFYPGISLRDLQKRGRISDFVIPRSIAIHLATKYHNLKSKTVAAYFGGRDRTCVNHANKVVEGYLMVDKPFRKIYLSIEKMYAELLIEDKESNEQIIHTSNH